MHELTNGSENTDEPRAGFLSTVGRYIRYGAIWSLVGTVLTSSIIYFFLNQGIQSTRALISENGDRVGRVETRIQESLSQQARAIDRLKDDVDAIRIFLATGNKDGSELSLDPKTRNYPYERLGMGGPGSDPVEDFFTYAKELSFDAKPPLIEAEKIELSTILRRALIADDRFAFDDAKHEIEVYETYYFPEESDDPRLELVAVAVYRTKNTIE